MDFLTIMAVRLVDGKSFEPEDWVSAFKTILPALLALHGGKDKLDVLSADLAKTFLTKCYADTHAGPNPIAERRRRITLIWVGTAAMLFLAFMSYIVTALPPFDGWECAASGFGGERPATSTADAAIPGGAICQSTYDSVFGSTWRIVVASITAFWAGEFVNSFVMAKMKVWTRGRALWTRTIGSTFVGQGVDSLIFYPVAFYGIWTTEAVLTVMVTNWALKVLWEAVLTPVTYVVVNRLKAAEGVDLFDLDTDFSPFASEKNQAV